MRIKLAILDSDLNYLTRIVTAFTGKFSDKLELYSFTDAAKALETVASGRVDIFIANAAFTIDLNALPKRVGFAYFVDSVQIETYNGKRTICKYQKVDLIYKEVLSIYSETSNAAIGLRAIGEAGTKILSFVSAAGGVGSSTLAAAFAKYMAKRGERTLYLNLEQFGNASLYFLGQGQFDFGDVVYAIKSKKSNLALKLESTVKQDASGVYFYDSCKVALDIKEMNAQDYKRLLEDLAIAGYAYIILDMDFSLDNKFNELFNMSHNIVFVSDGTEVANQKFERAYHALSLIEQQEDIALCSRISILYNKFSSKTGKGIENTNLQILGGAPRIEQATTDQILSKLQELNIFEKLI